MFNSRRLSPERADLQFEVMAYLVQNFGRPQRPSVPLSRHMSKGLESLHWSDSDTRSVFDWAQDNFGAMAAQSGMEDFAMCLVANDGNLDVSQIAAHRRLESLAMGQNPYHQTAGSAILYDPRDCTEPGHFAAIIALQLGKLRAAGFRSRAPLSPRAQRMVTVIAAAFNGQGFVLAHLPRQVSAYLTPDEDLRAIPHKIVTESLCFASCLALHIDGISEAQIIEAYGSWTTKPFRRSVRRACRQIKARGQALSALQNLMSAERRLQMA